MSTELLDRDVETIDLLNIINTPVKSNKIILISGISGVGKSGLVEKLAQSPLIKNAIIPVKISKSSVDTIENQQYFNVLYKTITQYAKSKMFDRIPSPAQQGAKSLKNLFKILVSILKSKAGISDISPLAEPAEDASIIRKKDYLLYILKKTNLIIDIENIQNIDTQSLEIITEIIRESNSITFIMEFTLNKSNFELYRNLYKELRELTSQIWCYKVEKMDFGIAKKLKPDGLFVNESELSALYEKSEGNLMEIILANENTTQQSSNIDLKLKKLSKNEKYILYIMFLNEYPVMYADLATMVILESEDGIIINFEQLEGIIDKLRRENIITKEKECIRIKHDSIIEMLQQYLPNPILYCAYITLKNYYYIRLDSSPLSVEKLLSLYLKFSDPELLNFLPRVKQFILALKYPDLIIKKLDFFRVHLLRTNSLGFYGIYYLTLMLVEICISKKMGDEAQKNLDLIYDESNAYHVAIQAQIYSLQERWESHDALTKLIQKIPSFSRLKLICEISLLYLKTKLQPTSLSKNYGKNLLNNDDYEQYTEYAFLLRNYAELCDDFDECNDLYLKALEIFKREKMLHEMASVYMSLSMINAYEGKLSLSKKYIEDAMTLDKRDLSLCYVLNNKAVLQILEFNYADNIEKNLRNALLLSVSKYEKLIIQSNLLVYYCLEKNFYNASTIANTIENADFISFKYEEILHIIYQDLYFFYSVFKLNEEKKQNYFNQILFLINSPDTRAATKNLASGINNLTKNDSFYARFPFRVDFLGYWEFTVDNSLSY